MKSITNILYSVFFYFNKLINLGVRENDNKKKKKLIALSNIFVLIISTYMFSMGISVFLVKEFSLAIFDFTIFMLNIINFIIFLRVRKLEIYSDIIIILLGITFIFLVISGGKNGTGPLWSIPFPLFALFLKGPKKGSVYSLLFIGLILIIFNLKNVYWIYDYRNKFENLDIISSRIILTQFALYIVSFFFSKNREDLFNDIEEVVNQKTNFFINITHETKTPLTLIRNYLENYIKRQGVNKELLIVKQNIQKLERDMVNLFDLEKLNKKQKFYNHNQLVNFSNILKIKISIFKEIASNKNIEIEKKIEEDIYIKIDPFALDRIINNLIDNAIKYSNSYGYIKIILREIKDKIEFIIKDSGIGIQKENFKNIFEPYFQLAHEKNNLQGIGIGLSIIKKILDDINASIEVKSKYNEGSIFIIHFDKSKKKIVSSNSNNTLSCSNPINFLFNFELKKEKLCIGKPIILIIEDNINLLAYLQNSLLDRYNVYYSLNGKEAINKLKFIPKPDLIISDIMMDEMDGFDLFQNLLSNDDYKSIPFIFITAKYNLSDKIRGLELGAVDFIFKPFSIHELNAKIQSLIKIQEIQKEDHYKKMERKLAKIIRTDIIKDQLNNSDFDMLCQEYSITPREKDIIKLLIKGFEYKEIAFNLKLSINTIKPNINKIYKKLKINNKIELVNFFQNTQ